MVADGEATRMGVVAGGIALGGLPATGRDHIFAARLQHRACGQRSAPQINQPQIPMFFIFVVVHPQKGMPHCRQSRPGWPTSRLQMNAMVQIDV